MTSSGELCSAALIAVLYAIPLYIAPSYNGTQLMFLWAWLCAFHLGYCSYQRLDGLSRRFVKAFPRCQFKRQILMTLCFPNKCLLVTEKSRWTFLIIMKKEIKVTILDTILSQLQQIHVRDYLDIFLTRPPSNQDCSVIPWPDIGTTWMSTSEWVSD